MSEVIYAYTRAQAIADGVLVDVTDIAKDVGIGLPTAVTIAVREKFIAFHEDLCCHDDYGRTVNILWMLIRAAGKQAAPFVVQFDVLVRERNRSLRFHNLKAICGPGDDGEPVITVMLPEED